MIIINEKEMWDAVTLHDVMDAIEKAYEIHRKGDYYMPERFIAAKEKNMMLYMPCFSSEYIGTKMLAEFPDNPKNGLPYLSGLMILNDAVTGQPKAIMNGSVLTAMRTGAVGGVGAKYLSKKDSKSVGLVGCGVQGLHQIMYVCAVRPIKDVYLYDAFNKDLSGFVNRLSEKLGDDSISIHVCENSTELLKHSDIVVSATQAVDPVYPNDEELLKGKCVIAVGSWRPERREVPDAVFKLINNVYTELPYACEESGDLRIPLETGVLKQENVKYMEDLIFDEKNGNPHKHNDTTYFKSVGMGLFDLCAAQLVYEKAIEKGIGQKIDWK